jgi:hypothetical protein
VHEAQRLIGTATRAQSRHGEPKGVACTHGLLVACQPLDGLLRRLGFPEEHCQAGTPNRWRRKACTCVRASERTRSQVRGDESNVASGECAA